MNLKKSALDSPQSKFRYCTYCGGKLESYSNKKVNIIKCKKCSRLFIRRESLIEITVPLKELSFL